MNAKLLSLGHGPVSNSVPFREKLLAGLMVFCIFFNGFIPRFNIGARDYEVLSQIMQRQSALLRFFSFSTLPVKLVNDLFAGRGALPGEHKKAPKSGNSTNASADYSFINLDKKTNMHRDGLVHRVADMTVLAARAAVSAYTAASRMRDGSPPGERTALLTLLLMLFLLPRSSVSDGPAAAVPSRKSFARFATANWVFSLFEPDSPFSRLCHNGHIAPFLSYSAKAEYPVPTIKLLMDSRFRGNDTFRIVATQSVSRGMMTRVEVGGVCDS